MSDAGCVCMCSVSVVAPQDPLAIAAQKLDSLLAEIQPTDPQGECVSVYMFSSAGHWFGWCACMCGNEGKTCWHLHTPSLLQALLEA